MKVYALCKIKVHPLGDEGGGATRGDVIQFLRADHKFSDSEIKHFVPILVDITIPCGDDFMRVENGKYVNWNCGKCKDNDPEVCEVQKYVRALWDEGTVFEAPKVLRKFRFKLDIDSILPEATLTVVDKEEKTTEEKASILDYAAKNEISKASVEDKLDGLVRR